MIPILEQLTLEVKYSLPASPSEVIPSLNLCLSLSYLKITLPNTDVSLNNMLLHLLAFEIYKKSHTVCLLGLSFLPPTHFMFPRFIFISACSCRSSIFTAGKHSASVIFFTVYALSHPWKYRLFSVLVYFKECC